MPYSQYTNLQSIRQQFNPQIIFTNLFANIAALSPSEWLQETLHRNTKRRLAYYNEKSRSEGIVFPILTDLLHQNNFSFSLYSGAIIEGDKHLGLNGECDFVLSKAQQSIELERPVFCIVEAKDNDIELGIPQCIAQLYGARLYNEKSENFSPAVLYGAVTTGTEWNFLWLQENTVYIDETLYYIANLSQLLGVLNHIVLQFSNNN